MGHTSTEGPRTDGFDEIGLPNIPKFEFDRFRNRVDMSSEEWRLNDPSFDGVLDWSVFSRTVVRQAVQSWIAHCIRAYSPHETRNQFADIKYAFNLTKQWPEELSDLDLTWWRELRQLMREEQTEYRLHRVRAWFLWLSDQGVVGIDEDAATEIESWTVPGNEKGEAVTRRDKDAGPLTELQFAVLAQEIRRPQPVTVSRVATMLCVDLGSNPKSIVLIEERDLHVFIDPKTGNRSYLLDVPRIKKRLGRRRTKARKVTRETGFALEALIETNHSRFGYADPLRPILCRESPRLTLANEMSRFVWHHTTRDIWGLVVAFGTSVRLRTPGAGDTSFRITPRRLRYTFATRLAAQGAAPAVIAELLDHTDLQHVMVYIEAAGRLADELTATIGPVVKPIYDRFLGRIVDRPQDAVPDDPAKHVQARVSANMLGHIGTCGSGTLCRLAPPLTCYLCDHFQPWRHADHEGLLENLRRFMATGVPAGGGRDMISRVISAVESVIKLKQTGAMPS